MIKLIIKRILVAIPVLWIIASLTFIMIRVVPGGPLDAEKNLPPQIVANIKAKYHLNRPILEQYTLYMMRLLRGDLGVSYKYVNRTVNDILGQALPVSLTLGAIGLSLAILIGIPLGTISALNRGTMTDFLSMLVATVGISVPTFVTGSMFMLIFGVWLRWLPVGLWESGWHMLLPAITLSLAPAAYLARLTRASILEVLQKEWVRTARAKGLSGLTTIIKHVLRNALLSVVTVMGPLVAIVITGSFIVEYIYAVPGMGRFFITAVSNRDYDLIIGTTLVFSVLLIIANTIVDILYSVLDPRIQIEG